MATPAIVQRPELPRAARPIVLIGAGGIARDAHLPAYRKAGFPVAGVYDRDRDKAAALARDFGIGRVYGSLEEAVRESPAECVFDVAVPASAILPILRALPRGSVVLIQKPMGEDLAEARAIRDFCRQQALIAAINFQLRYAPYVLAARSLIEQGAIGEVHDMEVRVTVETPWHLWSFMRGIPRVEISYHSIHYLDLMRAFLGEPRGVYAKVTRHPSTVELAGTRSAIILDYGAVTRATITTNHHHVYGPRHQESYVKWEGTRGAIKATLGVLIDYPKGIPDVMEYCTTTGGELGSWQNVPLEGTWFPDAFVGTMSSVQRFAEGSAAVLPTSVEDAYHTMALVEAAYASSEHGATPIPE